MKRRRAIKVVLGVMLVLVLLPELVWTLSGDAGGNSLYFVIGRYLWREHREAKAFATIDRLVPHVGGGRPSERLPRLVPLLRHEDVHVRKRAARWLNVHHWEPVGLTDDHLDALIAAHESRLEVDIAIAGVGSERAVDYLIGKLRAEGRYNSFYTSALARTGAVGGVKLARVFRDTAPVDERVALVIRRVFQEMREMADRASESSYAEFMGGRALAALQSAASELIAIAGSAPCDTENRVQSVRLLGAIGPHAAGHIEELGRIAERQVGIFADAARSARTQIVFPDSVESLTTQLRAEMSAKDLRTDWNTRDLIRRIGRLGIDAAGAGPTLMTVLGHPDWDTRVEVVRTLGNIGCTDAVPDLVPLLDRPEDWALTNACIRTLAQLRAKSCLPKLASLAATHWFPPIRAQATNAALVIAGEAEFSDEDSILRDYVDRKIRELEFGRSRVRNGELMQIRLGLLHLQSDSLLLRFPHDPEVVRTIRSEEQPECGIKIRSGILLGYEGGLFGRGLIWVGPNGHPQIVLPGAISGMYRTPTGVVVVAWSGGGLINDAVAHLVSVDADGEPQIVPWIRLPDADGRFAVQADDSVRYSDYLAELAITPQGEFRMAE